MTAGADSVQIDCRSCPAPSPEPEPIWFQTPGFASLPSAVPGVGQTSTLTGSPAEAALGQSVDCASVCDGDDSIDESKAWRQSRYDEPGPGGTGADYMNCAMNQAQSEAFVDALLACGEAGKLFIHYLAATANDICKDAKRQTISADDIMTALADLEFDEFVEPLKHSLEGE